MKSFLAPTLAALMLSSPALAQTGAAKRYEPNWNSIDGRPTPPWFQKAKFGIFIHWGLYSVPSWGKKGTYAEWYWNTMHDRNGATWKFHERVYGKDFPYQQFAPRFRAELFNPDQWADLFARSGAKYVVLTSKHHEGFCLWPNKEASATWGIPWNSVETGPKRDLLGDLGQAVRAKGLKMGFYYSLYEWYNPLYLHNFPKFVSEHFFPQFKDVCSKYKPSIIFADGEWEHSSAEWRTPELLAWLFNDSGCGDDLVINDRWGKETRSVHGGYFTTEYGEVEKGKSLAAGRAWEESRGMGASYGYNRNEDIEDYRTTEALLRLLAETVGKGGNLLIDIGPTADGRIPVIMQERLLGMGEWLKAHGEAIYETTASPLPAPSWGSLTRKGNTLYAIVFDWPKPGAPLRLPLATPLKSARLLHGGAVTFESTAAGVALRLPPAPPDRPAPVVVLECEGAPRAK